jgi:F-type H+-transporting ATPase subunit delta
MKKADSTTVAFKYAKALFEVSKQSECLDKTLSELLGIQNLFVEHSLSEILSSPQSEKVWLDLLNLLKGQISSLVYNFLALLGEMDRGYLLEVVYSQFLVLCDEHFGLVRGVLVTASDVGVEQRQALEALVSSKLGRKVVFEYRQDPSILGGVIAHVGGWTFDDSLKYHLDQIHRQLVHSF